MDTNWYNKRKLQSDRVHALRLRSFGNSSLVRRIAPLITQRWASTDVFVSGLLEDHMSGNDKQTANLLENQIPAYKKGQFLTSLVQHETKFPNLNQSWNGCRLYRSPSSRKIFQFRITFAHLTCYKIITHEFVKRSARTTCCPADSHKETCLQTTFKEYHFLTPYHFYS